MTLDVPIRGAEFAADFKSHRLIRSNLKSHDSNRNPKFRSICCDVFAIFLNVYWEKLNRGVSKLGGFPLFFGTGPDRVADPFGTVPRRCS